MNDGQTTGKKSPPTRPVDPAETAPPASSSQPTDAEGEPEEAFTQLPAEFGRYHLKRLVGVGGMGSVYLGHDSQLDRDVAVKIPNRTYRTKYRDRFLREARVAATLTHPNLCPVYDAGEIGEFCYLTMPFVEGRPLADFVTAGKPLPPKAVAALVRTLALAMQEAHAKGVVHRDLKPANVIITPKKQPVIMDFGLAVRTTGAEDQRLTQQGMVLGTPAYMPPEQVNGDVSAMGPASDVYSLGVIFYELLTGHVPFRGPYGTLISKILNDRPEPPSRLRPGLDAAFDSVCLKALAKRPADRFVTMTDFAAALDSVLHGERPQVGAIAEVLALAPDDKRKVEEEYAKAFQAPPPGSGVKRPSRPPGKRDPASVARRRRRRARRRVLIGVAIGCAALLMAVIVLGVYVLFTSRTDRAALAAVAQLTSSPGDVRARAALDEVKIRPHRYRPRTLEAVGRHLALTGDWGDAARVFAGLPKGPWKVAAELDLSADEPPEWIKAADAWWDVAAAESGNDRATILWHAGELFARALGADRGWTPEAQRRLQAIRGVPALTGWLDLTNSRSYSRAAPVAWRAIGRSDVTGSNGWQMAVGPGDQPDALLVRIDGRGAVHFRSSSGTVPQVPAALAKAAGQDNELTILVLDGKAEIYINGLAACLAVPLERAPDGAAVRCDVGPFASYAIIRSFEVASAERTALLWKRLADVK